MSLRSILLVVLMGLPTAVQAEDDGPPTVRMSLAGPHAKWVAEVGLEREVFLRNKLREMHHSNYHPRFAKATSRVTLECHCLQIQVAVFSEDVIPALDAIDVLLGLHQKLHRPRTEPVEISCESTKCKCSVLAEDEKTARKVLKALKSMQKKAKNYKPPVQEKEPDTRA